jgi:hypothetical protein
MPRQRLYATAATIAAVLPAAHDMAANLRLQIHFCRPLRAEPAGMDRLAEAMP